MQMNFKTYTGTKTIKAVPMSRTEAEKILGKSITPATPADDGYLVEYKDGYLSWSPKNVFEKTYRISETYVDRMRIELDELNERIAKARKATLTPELLSEEDRSDLKRQIFGMELYAEALYSRISKAILKSCNYSCKKRYLDIQIRISEL